MEGNKLEANVLKLNEQRKTPKEIARELAISEARVERIVRRHNKRKGA